MKLPCSPRSTGARSRAGADAAAPDECRAVKNRAREKKGGSNGQELHIHCGDVPYQTS